MSIYFIAFTFMVLDFVTGWIKALATNSYSSTKMREGLFHKVAYRQAAGFRPSTPEPDEGWMGELAAGWLRVVADLGHDADWQLPAPSVWTDSKQRRREALKKLAMGQKFGGDHYQGQTM